MGQEPSIVITVHGDPDPKADEFLEFFAGLVFDELMRQQISEVDAFRMKGEEIDAKEADTYAESHRTK